MHLLLARAEHAAEHSARTRRGELLLPCRVEHRSAQGASACVIFTRNESRNHAHRFPGRTEKRIYLVQPKSPLIGTPGPGDFEAIAAVKIPPTGLCAIAPFTRALYEQAG